MVSEEGVATDPAKIEKVKCPTTQKQLKQFLGLASYYRRFEKNIATKYHLIKKGAKFDTLRAALTTPPILAFPDFNQPFILDTDASDSGIGAVLSQVHGGSERVVAYASKTLSKAERNYSVTRRELLAVVTFVSHFRQYLLGTTFILRTDHNSLKWLNSFKHPEGQVARWLEKQSEYNFTIEHRPGRKHSNADSLSRVLPIYSVQLPADALLGMTMSEMRMLQLQDDVIAPVLTAKDDDQRPTEDHVRHYSRDTRRLFQ